MDRDRSVIEVCLGQMYTHMGEDETLRVLRNVLGDLADQPGFSIQNVMETLGRFESFIQESITQLERIGHAWRWQSHVAVLMCRIEGAYLGSLLSEIPETFDQKRRYDTLLRLLHRLWVTTNAFHNLLRAQTEKPWYETQCQFEPEQGK